MSQELRLRLASRRRLALGAHLEAEVPAPLRVRRFSEGVERPVHEDIHVGRFSEGCERIPEDAPSKQEVGRYSDGVARPRRTTHVGRFSEGVDHSEL
jgi:hypothetical protein